MVKLVKFKIENLTYVFRKINNKFRIEIIFVRNIYDNFLKIYFFIFFLSVCLYNVLLSIKILKYCILNQEKSPSTVVSCFEFIREEARNNLRDGNKRHLMLTISCQGSRGES